MTGSLSSSNAFLSSLADELRETAEDAIAMLEGRCTVDPVFLIDACATAGLLEGVGVNSSRESNRDLMDLRDRLFAASRTRAGRRILAEISKQLDLGTTLDLDPDEDPVDQVSRLDRLVELGGLATVADEATRERLDELFERNLGIALADMDRFEALHDTAVFLRDAVPVSPTHPVRTFIDQMIAVTSPLVTEVDEVRLQQRLDSAYEELAKDRWWAGLREIFGKLADNLIEFLDEMTGRPVPVRASSHGPERVDWPAPRFILTSPVDSEFALIANRNGVLLEWLSTGGGLWPREVRQDGHTLRELDARETRFGYFNTQKNALYWELRRSPVNSLDVLFANGTLRVPMVSTVAVDDVSSSTERWSHAHSDEEVSSVSKAWLSRIGTVPRLQHRFLAASLASPSSRPSLDLFGNSGLEAATRAGMAKTLQDTANEARFRAWRSYAPGAARELLDDLVDTEPSRARVQEALIARQRLRLRDLSIELGTAHFPVTGAMGSDFPGAIVTVRALYLSSALAASERMVAPAELSRVREVLRHLCNGAAENPLEGLTLRFEGLPPDFIVEGRSWELAALAAAVGLLTERAPARAIVASGELAPPELVQAVDEIKEKWTIIRREAPDVGDAFNVTSSTPAHSLLERMYGTDIVPKLSLALKSDPITASRHAVAAWREDKREVAARYADTALAGGVDGLNKANALWIRGAYLLHKAKTGTAVATLEEARALLRDGQRLGWRTRRFAAEEIEAYLGVAFIDLCRPRTAISLLAPVLERLEAIPEPDRDERWDLVRIQVGGSLARAESFVDRLGDAIGRLRDSLGLVDGSGQRARTLGDLAELYRRSGHEDGARKLLLEAREALGTILYADERQRTERFLRLYACRVGLARASFAITAPDWADWPQPAEVLEALLSTSSEAVTDWIGARLELADYRGVGPIALVIFRGAVARAAARFGDNPSLQTLLDRIQSSLAEDFDLDAEVLVGRRPDWVQLMRLTPY